MIGRLLEDGIFLARFAYNYYKAPSRVHQVGFYDGKRPIPFRTRVSYAYKATVGIGKEYK